MSMLHTFKHIKSTEHVLLLLLMLSLAFVPLLSTLYYDQRRLIELALLLITLCSCIYKNFEFPQYFSTTTLTSLFLLSLLVVISSLNAESIKYAALEIIILLAIIFTILRIAKAWEHQPNFFNIVLIVLLSSFFILEIKFYSYYLAFISSGNRFYIHDFFPNFAHTRFFNQYQLWSIPLLPLVFNAPIAQQKKWAFLIQFICISWWLMFFTTGGRGVIVSVIAGSLFLIFYFRKSSFDYLKKTLWLALCGFVLYQLLFHAIPYLIHQDSDRLASSLHIRATSSGRDILWLKALRLIWENPLLGVGPMHYGWFDPTGLDETHSITHPHNILLQLAAEWGLPATLLAAYLIFNVYKKWLTKFNRNSLEKLDLQKKELIIALTFASFAASIYSLFSPVFVMPMSQLMSIFIISLMLALYHTDQPKISVQKHNFAWFFIPLIGLYIYCLYPDIKEVLYMDNKPVDARDLHPRLWLRGNIYQRQHGF